MIEYYNKNATVILRIVILIILTWMSFGYFPILNIEGDSAFFSAGCERLYANGFKLAPDYFYEWNMQPLVGVIVVGFKYLIPGLSCELIYNLLTIICSITYLFIASIFISKLSKLRWEYCFILLFLFPESYSIAYYSNTAIFASLVSLIGFLLLTKNPINIISIFLLGIAPLLRVDILTIYPLILFLFWLNFSFKKTIIYSTLYALSTLTISTIGFYILKANPLNTFKLYQSLNETNIDIFNPVDFLKINASFYSLASILLIILGIIQLTKIKNFKLLLLLILPIITLYYIYGDFTGAATKHIQYLIPFTGLLVAFGIYEINNQSIRLKKILIIFISTLVVLQSFVGIRFSSKSKPWIQKTYSQQFSRPTLLKLTHIQFNDISEIQIVIGAGQVIPTADELMLLSGHFFVPFYWHSIKSYELSERKLIEKIISKNDSTLFFLTTQSSEWLFSQQLHNLGYKIDEIRNKKNNMKLYTEYLFKKEYKEIIVSSMDIDRNPNAFNNAFEIIKHRPLYVLSNWDWQLYMINEKMTSSQAISTSISVCK